MSIKYDGFSDIGGVDYNEGAPVAGGTQGSIQFNDGQGNFRGHPMANVVVTYDPNTGQEYANIYATNLKGTLQIGDPLYGVLFSNSQAAATSEILFINPETSTMTLYGNMVVTGDVNTLGANNLIVSDNVIEVGANATDSTNVGIVYQRPSGNVMTGYVTGGQYDNTFVVAYTDNSAFSYELHPNTESNIHMSVVGNVGVQNSHPLHYLSLGENGAQGTQYFEGNVIITSTGTTVRIGKDQDTAVNPSDFTVAVGESAGFDTQGSLSVSVGASAGQFSQGVRAVAIGRQAGECNQESQSIAIGYRAGHNNMGKDSIAIGALAGGNNMGSNSILLSAAGASRQLQIDNAFGVTPMNSTAVGGTQGNIMHYDPTTFEIRYDTAKTFVIPHPNRPGRMLVHGCLEGPEGGVYYRGKGNSGKPIRLPDYVPDLIGGGEPTIHVTPIGNNQSLGVSEWNRETNSFRVIADRPTDFHWTFTAMRIPVDVEPFETEVEVKGQGPYTYI